MGVFTAGLITAVLGLGGAAGALIDKMRWPVAHPVSAIICWTAVLAGTVTSIAGLLVVVLMSPPAPAHGLLDWLDGCLHQHTDAEMAVAPEAAAVGTVVLIAMCCLRLARGVPRLWRSLVHLRQHREVLRIVARKDDRHPDLIMIDHPVPVAYCLPARDRPIVMSTGARARLAPTELAAVLAHERAHLRQRHHLLLLLLDLTCTLVPWLPTLRRAKVSLPPLLEMAADDHAARRCGPRALSGALQRLTVLPGPAGALAAAGTRTGTGTGTGTETGNGNGARSQAMARRLARLELGTSQSSAGVRALARIAAAVTVVGCLGTIALALLAIPLPC
jgi:Zn-dependent protease with chaperone function